MSPEGEKNVISYDTFIKMLMSPVICEDGVFVRFGKLFIGTFGALQWGLVKRAIQKDSDLTTHRRAIDVHKILPF